VTHLSEKIFKERELKDAREMENEMVEKKGKKFVTRKDT
jgi:hypothetical protein